MKRVVVTGGTGMLGSMLVSVFVRQPGWQVYATARGGATLEKARRTWPAAEWIETAADHATRTLGFEKLPECDCLVNAIGITKPLIKDEDPDQVDRAIWVNAVLPSHLAALADRLGARMLQIATDCVFSGKADGYDENSPHDCLDVYGKSKSLGECRHRAAAHLRCSIIGPEWQNHRFLLDWLVRQPHAARVRGFRNHCWNGVTTFHFARLCVGVISHGLTLPHLQHVVPGDRVSKLELLEALARCYRRGDVGIDAVDAPERVDRSLATVNRELNRDLWKAAGYEKPPSVGEMVAELSQQPFP